VNIANPGPRPLRVDPQAIALVDSDGFVERPVTIRRAETGPSNLMMTPDVPPGSFVEGAVGYLLLDSVGIDRLVYTPSRDRLIDIRIISAAPSR
jgi:hypothetical protein